MSETPEQTSTPDPKIAEALSYLEAAKQSAETGDPSRVSYTIHLYDQAVEKLAALAAEGGNTARLQALAWVGRASIKRSQGPEGVIEALSNFDQAINLVKGATVETENEDFRKNDLADIWINRGITQLGNPVAEAAAEAIRNFDEAIALRKELPAGPENQFRYGLADAYMHRAVALGRSNSHAEAVSALESAIAVMRELPIDENDWFRHQLAIAQMNRAAALQAQGADFLVQAIGAMDETIALLKGQRILERNEGKHLLAAAYINRAGLLLAAGTVDQAHAAKDAITEARALTDSLEKTEPAFADLGIKSRHAYSRLAGFLLSESGVSSDADKALVDSATDAVDEGLALWREWEQRGVGAFRQISSQLFQFGCMLYLQHQPHFLAEFVLENLDPKRSPLAVISTPFMQQTGVEVVAVAVKNLEERGITADAVTLGAERLSEALKSLRGAQARFEELHQEALKIQAQMRAQAEAQAKAQVASEEQSAKKQDGQN